MKKLLLLTMLLAAALCLTACGGDSTAQTPTQKPDTVTENANPTDPTQPTEPEATQPTDPETPSHTHVWTQWETTIEPTFTVTGEAKRTCEECQEAETKVLETLTMDEEMNRLATLCNSLPEFTDVSELSAGAIFGWVGRAGRISSDWSSETYLVTIVYSVDKMDAHSTAYLGTTFDYMYLVENNENMSYDPENNNIILVTGASGGGPMAFYDSYEQIDDTHYSLRYSLMYPEEGEPYRYGTVMLVLTENGFQFESHTTQAA